MPAYRRSSTPPPVRSYITKTELAVGELRDRILQLALAPGQTIIIDETARQLGISPIPVREALQLLAAEGLVELKPHIGVIVSPITRRSVVELFTILEGLETAVCRHAVERATKDDLIALSEMLGQLDEIRVTREPDRWAELNAEFHLGLAALAGLPRIDAELAQALDHWDRIRRAFFSDVLSHRAAEAQAEHRKILDALKSRKPERVEELLRDHNRVALKHYLKLLPDDTKPRS